VSDTLSGFLLWGESASVRSALATISRVEHRTDTVPGWHQFDYTVSEEIPGVDVDEGPPFVHSLLVRWGGDRLMVLSNNYRICDHFLDRDLRRPVKGMLKKVDIAVHELVVAIAEFRKTNTVSVDVRVAPSDTVVEEVQDPASEWEHFNLSHALGYGFARSDAFGRSLQRVEFEGDDLTQAPLFLEAIPLLRFRTCGLRQRVLDERGFPTSVELLRLGKAGFISFSVPVSERGKRDRFRDVESVLRALNKFGYIR
jgi:hypothetical protein